MRGFRAAVVPVLLLAAVCALACFDLKVDRVAHFGFIWDVLLGAALGAGLSLLPALCGYGARRNALTSMYWVCGFAALLLIFYQYMTLVTGMQIESIAFVGDPGPRMRIAEGALLGYSSLAAGRGKA